MNFEIRKTLIGALVLLLVSSCDRKTNDRYELVRTENGFIRLDHQTGEMLHIDKSLEATAIDLSFLADQRVPGDFKVLGKFGFPEYPKGATITIECRGYADRLEYRLTVSPLIPALMSFSLEDKFEVVLTDAQGFPVRTIDILFPTGVRVDSADGKKDFVSTGWERVSAKEYARITAATCTWRFSAETKQHLLEDK